MASSSGSITTDAATATSDGLEAAVAAIVGATPAAQGMSELRSAEVMLRRMATAPTASMPLLPMPTTRIELLLRQLACMDSNNFVEGVGAGEREGRLFSSLVRARVHGFAHGIGRSGDLAAVQPKAAGSSLLYRIVNGMALQAVRACGIEHATQALVVPCATGVTHTLTLLAAARMRPRGARLVLWSRIDQKSCFKAILAAGLEPVIVPLRREGDQLVTDVSHIHTHIHTHGPDAFVAVITTTSCFAPRAPDDILTVAQLCKEYGIPHIINNAYGLQSRSLTRVCDHTLTHTHARVDAIIQSCDKNFMVPVGGAVIVCGRAHAHTRTHTDTDGHSDATTRVDAMPSLVDAVSRMYPGRASMAPALDLFVTLLEMGVSGLQRLIDTRKDVAQYLLTQLRVLTAKYGERVLESPKNPISFAISIDKLCGRVPAVQDDVRPAPAPPDAPAAPSAHPSLATPANDAAASVVDDTSAIHSSLADAATRSESTGVPARTEPSAAQRTSMLGSMLFSRGVSGARVVVPDEVKHIDGYSFRGFGAQYDEYPTAYLTVAAAIGMTSEDVDVLIKRLDKTFKAYQRASRGYASARLSAEASRVLASPAAAERVV